MKKIFKGIGVFILGYIISIVIGGFFNNDTTAIIIAILYLSSVIFVSIDKLVKE